MENPPSRSLTLFTETGTVKLISTNKLVLESEHSGTLDIYVPNKIPCAPNDQVEITVELTEHGFVGRRVQDSQKGVLLPILPSDFLILSEYLRFGFISIVGMLFFIVVGVIFPVYFLSIVFPVFLGFHWLYYHGTAVVVGKHVPNYNRATISPLGAISPEKYSQFFVKRSSPPLFKLDATLKIAQGTPAKGALLQGGREFPLTSPVNVNLLQFNNMEGSWVVNFQKDEINVLGIIERDGHVLWTVNQLLSMGFLIEIIGYLSFFFSIVPGFFMYGLGAPVPFSGDLLTSLFITCMFVGCCLILVGKIASLKKRCIQNNIIVEYKGS